MQWQMSDEQFCGLLNWQHPVLAGIDESLPAAHKALAAAAALRRLTPRTLTVPARIEKILEIWQRHYPDDVQSTCDLLERTVLRGESPWQPDKRNYAHLHEGSLRRLQTGRHQAVPLAARLYALTGQRKYLDVIVELIRQFVREAPPCPDGDRPAYARWMPGYTGMDVLWASHVMENWLLALPIIHRDLADADYLMILKALACGADYEWRCWRREFYYNFTYHGVKAAAGVGLAFDVFKDAAQWLQLGLDRYFGDLTRPPHCMPDGYTRESLGYQCVNTYLTAKWYLLCSAHGIRVPNDFAAALEAMFDFAAKVVKPDGSRPMQGETGADAVHEHYILEHELLQLGAALFNRSDWRRAAGSINDDRLAPQWLWIVDPDVYERWKATPGVLLTTRCLPSSRCTSKFYSLRSGRGLQALCAQTYALNPHNHGHYDALHLEVYGLGRTLISDTGCASYRPDIRQRDWQPQRHSSIHLAGLNPRPKQHDHDGYTAERLWHDDGNVTAVGLESLQYPGYRLRRFVLLLKSDNVIAVVDRICPDESQGPAPRSPEAVETRFAFHTPVMSAGFAGNTVWSQHVPHAEARLHPHAGLLEDDQDLPAFDFSSICRTLGWSDSDANVLVRPLLQPESWTLRIERGWLCVSGGLLPRPVATFTYTGAVPVTQAWEILPFRETEPPRGVLSVQPSTPDAVTIRAESLSVRLAGLDGAEPELVSSR